MSESIGKRILRLRIENEMKQKELAEKVEITEATLSRYENDLRSPKGEIVSKLAEALGVSSDYILRGHNNSFSPTSSSSTLTIEGQLDKKAQDVDIRRIERARNKMNPKDREKMMKILEASFEDYFDDED